MSVPDAFCVIEGLLKQLVKNKHGKYTRSKNQQDINVKMTTSDGLEANLCIRPVLGIDTILRFFCATITESGDHARS